MVAFILPANSVTGGYEISNSLRFQPNDYVSRYDGVGDEASNAGKIGTVSLWTKRGDLGRAQGLFVVYEHNGQGYQTIWFNSDDTLQLAYEISGTEYQVKTNAKFTDPSAWYHVVAMTDTTQATDSNRMKIYVNGTEQTYSSTAYPPQDTTLLWGKGNSTNYQYRIGNQRGVDSTSYAFYSGYISEVHLCMGQNYTASEFGETNDNGVWIPKEADVSYGTNGGFYEFKQTGTGTASASTIGADTSGTGNHAGTGGLAATDITTDTPMNNFCTLSSIDVNVGQVPTFEEGNTKFTVASGNNHSRTDATIRPSSGKWYAEFTFLSGYSTANGTTQVGIISGNAGRNATNNDGYDQDNGNDSEAIGYRSNGSVKNHGTESLSGLTTFTTDDIMGIALDLDNDKFFVSKNGTFFTNGTGTQDPPNGTNPLFSGGVITSHKIHGFNIGAKGYGDAQNVIAANFGNPHTSISSGNSDANGYGNFEYAPPSGFYAVCTKNLAEFG